MNTFHNLSLPQSLQEEQVGSTLYNVDCNKDVARHDHFKERCIRQQRFIQFTEVLQRRNRIARQTVK